MCCQKTVQKAPTCTTLIICVPPVAGILSQNLNLQTPLHTQERWINTCMIVSLPTSSSVVCKRSSMSCDHRHLGRPLFLFLDIRPSKISLSRPLCLFMCPKYVSSHLLTMDYLLLLFPRKFKSSLLKLFWENCMWGTTSLISYLINYQTCPA